MLAENEVVQILYLCFWSVETIETIAIAYILFIYYTEIEHIIAKIDRNKSTHSKNVYFGLTVAYVALSVLRLIGFMGVYAFKVTIKSQEIPHLAMASLGFGVSILISVLLFARRVIYWNHAIDNRKLDHVVLAFNFIYVLGLLACAIVFIFDMQGIPEMTLAFLLQAETLWIIYDIWKDPETFKKEVVKVRDVDLLLPKKSTFISKMLRISRQKKHIV